MKSVIIGFGNAANIHIKNYPNDVKVAGVVDTNPKKLEEAKAKGYETFSSVEAASGIRPDFWDVCVPTESHISTARTLLENLGNPNILVEKPVCSVEETADFRKLAGKYPGARISVNENYLSSNVTAEVASLARELFGNSRLDARIEFSKNRTQDVLNGRFLDPQGVAGYEGSHMLTCLAGVLGDINPAREISIESGDMVLPSGKTRDGKSVLENQGSLKAEYRTRNGSSIFFYTSMDGKVGIKIPEMDAPDSMPVEDAKTRYRVIYVGDGEGVEILGRYEPIGETRNKGRIVVKEDGSITEDYAVEDNSMNSHLGNIIEYFEGKSRNPSPVNEAADIVGVLYKLTPAAKGL